MKQKRREPHPRLGDEATIMLRAAVQEKGGYGVVGKALDPPVTSQCVNYWVTRRVVPAERVRELEKIIGVPKHILRPDLWDTP